VETVHERLVPFLVTDCAALWKNITELGALYQRDIMTPVAVLAQRYIERGIFPVHALGNVADVTAVACSAILDVRLVFNVTINTGLFPVCGMFEYAGIDRWQLCVTTLAELILWWMAGNGFGFFLHPQVK
jgi:hypothetical protein